MTKALIPPEYTKSQVDRQQKDANKTFDYTMFANRFRKVSWEDTVIQLVWLDQFTGPQASN